MPLVSGLDLGQASDPSAWAIADMTRCPHPTRPGDSAWSYGIRHLKRWHLGTPYPQIVSEVRDSCNQKVQGEPLVIDGTGVGRAVVDLFRETDFHGRIIAVTITGGHNATEDEDRRGWHVPKKDLVAVMQSLLQTRRLHISPHLPDAEVLRRELGNFKIKITAAANETFGAWREGEHDDLVLAVAMACWWGEKSGHGPILPAPESSLCEAAKAPKGVFMDNYF